MLTVVLVVAFEVLEVLVLVVVVDFGVDFVVEVVVALHREAQSLQASP